MRLFWLVFLLPGIVLAAPQIVRSFDGPDTGVSGLACSATELYAVTGPSHKLFRLNPETGAVISSWTLSPTNLNGLALAGGNLYVTNGSSTVYWYSTSGTALGSSMIMCSG